MTADVKDELSRVEGREACCRKAETASIKVPTALMAGETPNRIEE